MLSLLTAFLLFAPPSTPPLLQKGLRELQSGQLQAAEQDLETAAKADGQNALIWSALAETYAEAHQPQQAAAAADKAQQWGANNPVVQHGLAIYYSHAGDFMKAAESEERFAHSPQGDWKAAVRASGWYLAANDSAKALPLAEIAIRTQPHAGFELAQILLHQQQFTEAAELLQSGLKAHPDDPELTLALGVARYGQRRFDDAITLFLRVVQLDKTIDQPYLFLGRMLDQAGSHLPEITRDAESWVIANPTNPQADLLLAKIRLLNDPKDPQAETLLRSAIALDDHSWEAHYQLGVLLEASHQYSAAAGELRRAAELQPKEAMPHYHLARVYDRLGDSVAAAREREIHQGLTSASH